MHLANSQITFVQNWKEPLTWTLLLYSQDADMLSYVELHEYETYHTNSWPPVYGKSNNIVNTGN